MSGAGRALKENLLHAELSEGYHALCRGRDAPALGEFDQEFSKVAGREVRVQFTPHLIPANRGILATVYVKGDPQEVHSVLEKSYSTEPFLFTLPFGELPSTRHVRGSNFCHIGVVWRPHSRPHHRGRGARQPHQGVVGSGDAERQPDAGPRRDNRSHVGARVSVIGMLP